MRSDTPAATVDILDALLANPSVAAEASPGAAELFPGLDSLDRLIRRAATPPAPPRQAAAPVQAKAPEAKAPKAQTPRPKPAPAAPRAAAPPEKNARCKVTHTIGATTRNRLDQAKSALELQVKANVLKGAKKGRVTKSGLVEAALSLVLDEYESKGSRSPLAKYLRTTRGAAPAPASDK